MASGGQVQVYPALNRGQAFLSQYRANVAVQRF